jgi:pimeloyl-ACP methyl ester carboxylesterase
MAELPTLEFVHSPLVGPFTWEPAARCFRRRGYPVVVCSLAGLVDDGAPYYRRFAEAAARAVVATEGGRPAVLVGHSGGGALLPAIADAVGGRIW